MEHFIKARPLPELFYAGFVLLQTIDSVVLKELGLEGSVDAVVPSQDKPLRANLQECFYEGYKKNRLRRAHTASTSKVPRLDLLKHVHLLLV